MNQNTTYDGRTAFENAQVGDVIRVPQYEGALKVNYDGRDTGMLGVEFVEDGRGSASKHLIQNENSGRVYLVAGQYDKGEVEEVEVVTSVEREDEDTDDEQPDDETETVVPEGGDDPEEALSRDSTHNLPVEATESSGRVYAVKVEETHGDGSTHTDHYTEAQARKLRDDLNDLLGEDDDENPDMNEQGLRPDGGVQGATDDDVRTAVESVESDDDPELVTDGGVPVEDPYNDAADDSNAKLIRVRGESDGTTTLSVYYRVGPTTFRARLRPVRPLSEEDHIRDREALVLSDLCSLDVPDLDGFEFVGPDAPVEEWFDTTHVPPVVRRAVDRPVQVPDLGNPSDDPDGR